MTYKNEAQLNDPKNEDQLGNSKHIPRLDRVKSPRWSHIEEVFRHLNMQDAQDQGIYSTGLFFRAMTPFIAQARKMPKSGAKVMLSRYLRRQLLTQMMGNLITFNDPRILEESKQLNDGNNGSG